MTGATAPLRVALADDSAESRALLRAMLEVVDGVDVVGMAADGAQAVELVAQESPDLVLLDIAMPVMDGLEAATAIRAGTPGTKIAMYSGYSRVRMRPAALAAGADEYVEKVASIDELLDQIQRLFPDGPTLSIRAPHQTPPTVAGAGTPPQTSLEQRYRLLLDALEEGVLVTDGEGLVSDANFVATQVLRAPLRRLIGRTLGQVGQVGLSGGSAGAQAVARALRTQRPVSGIDYNLTRPDGEQRNLMVSVRPLHDPASLEVHENLVSFVDLTDLKRAEQQLHAAVVSMHEGFYLLRSRRDGSGAITDLEYVTVNEEACRVAGHLAAELVGHGLLELDEGHGLTGLFDRYRDVVETGEPYHDVVTYDLDGIEETFEFTITKAGDGILILTNDITERLRVEADVRHLTDVLNRTQQIARTGGWQYEPSTARVAWTDEVYRIYGIDKTDEPPSLAAAIAAFDPASRQTIEEAWGGAVEDGRPYDVEVALVRGDGERIWVRAVGEPVLQDGRVTRIEGMLVDVTAQRAAREALAVSEQRHRQMLETTQEGAWMYDAQGVTNWVNARIAALLGYTTDEMVGRPVFDFVSGGSLADYLATIAKRRIGIAETFELELRGSDGRSVWVLDSASPIIGADGTFGGALAMLTDITDRKRAELALRASQDSMSRAFNAVLDGLVILAPERDEVGRVVDFRYDYINDAGCRLNGLPRERHIGRLVRDVLPGFRESGLFDDFVHVLETGEPLQRRSFFYADADAVGGTGRVPKVRDLSLVPMDDGRLLDIFRDVTDEARAEQSRKDAEERLHAAVESMSEAFFLASARRDERGAITDLDYTVVNGAACRLTGLDAQSLVGHGHLEFWPNAEHFAQCCAVVETGTPFTTTLEADVTPLGVMLRISVTKVGDGCALVVTDVSEQVQHERDLAESRAEAEARAEQLSRSNRDLEAFASALSHDLREPLRTTAGFVHLITDHYAEDLPEPARELFAYITSGTERMNDRITAILSFARAGAAAAPPHPVDSAAAAAAAANDCRALLTEAGAELDTSPLPVVNADALQLQRVFQNLITNATKYTRPGTTPHITLSAERLGDDWRFTVADDGPGIPEAQRERIFAMFVRGSTSEEHAGHGMGLALCRRIIESYDGHIWVEPNPNGGSLFRFTLPAANVPADLPPPD